jgi:hypothetical protein
VRPQAPGQDYYAPPPVKTHRVRTVLVTVAAVLIAACTIGAVIAGMSPRHKSDLSTFVTASPSPQPPVKALPPKAVKDGKPTPTKTVKPISAEQRNATSKAVDYLDDQAFSRKGLIDQLKFEGYSAKASTAAVDSLKVDWNAQAVAKAKDYLSDQSFSRSGLRDQLEFEGFTSEQAAHGVLKAYSS